MFHCKICLELACIAHHMILAHPERIVVLMLPQRPTHIITSHDSEQGQDKIKTVLSQAAAVISRSEENACNPSRLLTWTLQGRLSWISHSEDAHKWHRLYGYDWDNAGANYGTVAGGG